MPTCPNGHQSGSEDWCEVCGHRMGGSAVPPPPAAQGGEYGYPPQAAGPVTGPELCPQCQTPREANAPYCEQCRWNFLTNTATSYTPLAPRGTPGQGAGGGVSLPPGFQTPPPAAPAPQAPPAAPDPQTPPAQPASPGPQAPWPPESPFGSTPPESPFGTTPPESPFGTTPPESPFGTRPPEPSFGNGPGGPSFGNGPAGPYGTRPPEPPFETRPPEPYGTRPPEPPYERTGTRPSQINRPAEPLVSESAPGPGPGPARPGGGVDDPWGAPRPPQFDQVSPPPGTQHPAPASDEWAHTPAGPPFTPPPPGPSADDDWRLPPPSQQGPFPNQPGMGQTAPSPGVPQQAPQGGPGQRPPQFPGSSRWAAVIGPDREYFMAMMHRSGPEAAGLNLPAYSPEQHMPLTGNQITIGRRRHSTGESPDIDLSVPPEDPGVSHQHAMLVQQPDGGWAVVDQNSTNGTTVNGGEEPIQPFVPVPLADGDRVHVGAWTTIRIVQA